MTIIYGVGLYDTRESRADDGWRIYTKWRAMLQRCYTDYGKVNHPSYKDNIVCEEWKTYSNYKKWFTDNYVTGFDLDKDLLVPGNKIYSPETCAFVPKRLNRLLVLPRKGQYPWGVYLEKDSGKYKAQGFSQGKFKNLGRYRDPLSAHKAWQKNKVKEILLALEDYAREDGFNTKVAEALNLRVWGILLDIQSNRVTESL